MNGSENGYAGALFFALISLGAVLKIEDFVTGLAICVGGALLAAISLRRALNRSAQAAEEDHQRMEIQFQQLRAKINETSAASIDAMSSLSEVAQLLQDNLKIIREQSATMEDLITLIKNAESVNSLVASLEENSAAQNAALEKIHAALEKLGAIDASAANKNLSALIKINDTFSKNLAVTLDNLRFEVSRLSGKIETVNGAAREDKTPLTAQDIDQLKKIVAKINLK